MARENEVRQGDIVWYHGSIKDSHSMYRVAYVRRNPYSNTMHVELHPLDEDSARFLYNARESSVTIIRRVDVTDV